MSNLRWNSCGKLILVFSLTAMLVFSVLMLAAEKHRATYIAPIGTSLFVPNSEDLLHFYVGIGLVLFACQLFGTSITGCSMNSARSFGPAVISRSFDSVSHALISRRSV